MTYAVDEGTVTVTAAALPADELSDTVAVVGLVLPASLAVIVASTELVACVVSEEAAAAALKLASGTFPKTPITLLLSKQPTSTPVVVFSGMAAHTWVPSQPVTSHDPELVQYEYSALIQA